MQKKSFDVGFDRDTTVVSGHRSCKRALFDVRPVHHHATTAGASDSCARVPIGAYAGSQCARCSDRPCSSFSSPSCSLLAMQDQSLMQRAKPHVLEAVQYVEESRLEPVSYRATRSVSMAASLPWWLQRHNKRAHAPDAFTSSSFHVQFKLWKACALEILGKGMWVSGLVEESSATMLADRCC